MSRHELERLLSDLRTVADLGAGFDRLHGDVEAQVRWANEHGYAIDREEVDGMIGGGVELSDEELEEAAGGWTGDPATDPGTGTTGTTTPDGTGGTPTS